jgi:hypothetical protein
MSANRWRRALAAGNREALTTKAAGGAKCKLTVGAARGAGGRLGDLRVRGSVLEAGADRGAGGATVRGGSTAWVGCTCCCTGRGGA